jgi:hypothetical protein
VQIEIKTVSPESQRYATLGDWFDVEKVYLPKLERPEPHSMVVVSELGDPRYEFLVALHELVEMFLCKQRGITAGVVDQFDMNWKQEGEPGNDPASPYFREHQFASSIERQMAHELGVNWAEYENRLEEVEKGVKR